MEDIGSRWRLQHRSPGVARGCGLGSVALREGGGEGRYCCCVDHIGYYAVPTHGCGSDCRGSVQLHVL